MKQSVRDMHASIINGGEEGVDAREVFTDLGVLIVEGRVPGGQYATGRGYGEGPHCPKPTPAAAVARHDCDSSFLCQRAENLRKHLQLLWENNVPLCVEVLLCSDCSCGTQKASCTDVANVPSPGDLLLEQWLVTMVPVTKRCPDPVPMTVRGLFQAVRSQLHFSQLCAWWSSSKGSNPAHVNYRVTVPGEAFASQFRNQPQVHSFPIASVSKTTCIKVSVRTTPRTEFIPKVLCNVHHKSELGAVGGDESVNRSVKLLGESLLDPPQNVDHFSRKYQSSSRSKSPATDVSDLRTFARCRRDDSPPSPPMSLQHPRRGRQGLARRRDVSFTDNIPGVVDDRMQNPCTRPGKHHCRCAFDEELDPLPCTNRRKATTSPAKDNPAQLSLSPAPSSRVTSPLCSSKTHDDDTPNTKSHFDQESFEKCIEELPHCQSLDKVPLKYYSKPSTFSEQSCSTLGSETKCDPKTVCPEKQAKRVRKEEHCDVKTTTGRKLNLELSQREFEEVLLVLRDRNGPSSHHGSKSHSYSTASTQELKCQPDSKPQPLHNCTSLVYNVQTPLQPKTSSSGKADLFMEAILRTSDNNAIKTKTKSSVLETTSISDEVSALSRQLSKISFGVDKKSCSASDSGSSSGAKRKRFDFKNNQDEETLHHCDSGSIKRPSDPLFVFDDNLPSNNFLKSLTSGGNFTAKSNQNDFDCLSSTIDERPLMSISRTKLNKRRCDLKNKVPCDALDGKNVVSKSSFTVIKDGDPYPPQISNLKVPVPRTRIETNKSDIIVPLQTTETNKLHSDIADKTSGLTKDLSESKETDKDICKTRQVEESQDNRPVPSASEKAKFRRNLDTAASLVFHSRTGLPLTSSPAPVRRNATCFDFDSSINCVSAIRSALFESATPAPLDDNLSFSSDDAESEESQMWGEEAHFDGILTHLSGRSPCSPKISLPPVRCCWSHYPHLASSLLGTFEESVLNGRLEPVSTVQGFTANLGASGSFCPRHVTLPITVFFYTLGDNDKVSTPYLAHINLGKKGYNVPRCGTIQVTLFNPLGTVVKMFVVMYDLSDMPPNSHTFLRQRTLYMPAKTDSSCQPDDFQKWLRYLIHLRFTSSKSGRIYLHTDIRMIIFRKSDLDTATAHGVDDVSYELRSFTQGPTNPKFSSRK